ncbi:MAG: MATE family efflux transporter [Clostridia bacterium]|nr:MATE family efflux transporter [Clostridia bacterium]
MDTNKGKILKDYTKGNLPKQILLFSLPFMLSNALQVLFSIVDMIVVGNVVGSSGLSAVSTASHIVTFMTMICLGFATGGQVYIAQLIGADKKEDLNKAIGTLFTFTLILGVLMTTIGLTLARPILTLMKTPTEAMADAIDYLLICSGGVIFTFGYNCVSAVLRGMGNSTQPFVYILIAAIINIVLDILFVLYMDMGVAGAAWATIIGQGVSFLTSIIYLFIKRKQFGFDFRPRSFIPDKQASKVLIKLGIPFSLRSGAVNVSMLFVTSLVNGLGVAASAVFGVGLKVDDMVRKISIGVNYSVSTFVGQNFAAKELDRTKKSVYWGWLYSFLIYLVFLVVYLVDVEGLFGLFTKDEAVLELAHIFVQAILFSFPAMIIMRGTNGFVQGIGNSMLSMIFSLLDGFILRIGLSYLLGNVLGLGLFGLFLGYGLAAYGTAIPGMIYFFSKKWKNAHFLDNL